MLFIEPRRRRRRSLRFDAPDHAAVLRYTGTRYNNIHMFAMLSLSLLLLLLLFEFLDGVAGVRWVIVFQRVYFHGFESTAASVYITYNNVFGRSNRPCVVQTAMFQYEKFTRPFNKYLSQQWLSNCGVYHDSVGRSE